MIDQTIRHQRPRPLALLALAALASMGMVLGGCKTVSESDYDAAIAENNELRQRLDEAQTMLADADRDLTSAEQRNQDLARDLADLQTRQAAQPVAAQPINNSGLTGATTRGSDLVVEVAGDVLFASGQATLQNNGKRELDRIAREILRGYSNYTVRVEGYTDSDPIRKSKWGTNERLSAERALAVEAYLVQRGLDADNVYAAALGPANPRSTKQRSRRVEIVVLDGAG